MTNAINNAAMSQFNFTTKTVNPADLKVHEILSVMGYVKEGDEMFINTAKHYGFYGKPVIDADNNVITNSAEVAAAVRNGITELEVFECSMDKMELIKFIAFVHRYHRKDLIASFNTVLFYEEYFETEEGKILAASINKDSTREKIAYLMNTSDSTVKRLMYVGRNRRNSLGLIEQGEKSLKEVEQEIKNERMEQNTAKRKAEALAKTEVIAAVEVLTNETELSAISPEEEVMQTIDQSKITTKVGQVTNKPNFEERDDNDSADNDNNDDDDNNCSNNDNSDNNGGKKTSGNVLPFPVSKPPLTSGLDLAKMNMELTGLGTLSFNKRGHEMQIDINGNSMSGVEIQKIENLVFGSGNSSTTFLITTETGFSVTVIVENPAAAQKKAA